MRLTLFLLSFVSAFALSAADFLDSLPSQSAVVPGYGAADSVELRMSRLPLCPAEGIWQMTDGGALFAIERAEPSPDLAPLRLRMVMIRSPWRSIRPGTVIGHLVPTARRGVYEARLYSDVARRTGLNIPRGFTLELTEDDALMTIRPFRSPVRLNLFRLLPYMYRRVISLQDSRPDNLNGAVKVFPRQAAHPLSPVYL